MPILLTSESHLLALFFGELSDSLAQAHRVEWGANLHVIVKVHKNIPRVAFWPRFGMNPLPIRHVFTA